MRSALSKPRELQARRKAIPLIFFLFLVYWFATLSFMYGFIYTEALEQALWLMNSYFLHGVAAVLLILFICLSLLHRSRLTAALQLCCLSLVTIILSCMLSITNVSEQFKLIDNLQLVERLECRVRLLSDPKSSKFGATAEASIVELKTPTDQIQDIGEQLLGKTIRLRLDKSLSDIRLGQELTANLSFKPLNIEDERDKRQFMKGILAYAKLGNYELHPYQGNYLSWIYAFRTELISKLAPETSASRAFLSAILLGYTDALEGFMLREDFARTGLSHLVAVSGSHLAITLAFIQILLKYLRLPKALSLALLLIVSFGYVALSGFQISALRAWIMAIFALSSSLFKRSSSSLSALGSAACIMISLSVYTALSLSFTLSVLSVVGIILFSSYIQEVLIISLPDKLAEWRIVRFVSSAISLSFISQLICLPVTLPIFSYISLSSCFTNIVMGLLVSLSLSLGLIWILIHGILPQLASYLLSALEFILSYALSLVKAISANNHLIASVNCPAWMLYLIIFGGLFLLWLSWPHIKRLQARIVLSISLIFCIALGCYTGFHQSACIALDIGQGDAIYLQDHDKNLLIDTGEDATILKALARNHVKELDAVLLTHLDKDHVGGMEYLADYMSVHTVFVAQGVKEALPKELLESFLKAGVQELIELRKEDVFRIGNFECKVLWPQHKVDGNENEDSLVIMAHHKVPSRRYPQGLSILLTGDAESDTNQALIDAGYVHSVDVLKVGHHGARVCLNEEQAKLFSPDFALISCGAYNRYGHPHEQVLQALNSVGSQVLRTDQQGDVGLQFNGREWSLYQQK